MLEKIIDQVFPPYCGICGKMGKKWICSRCYRTIKEKVKLKKIKITKNIIVNYLFLYQDIFREKILHYKFNEESYLYKTFSEIILKDKKICEFIEKFDYIVPVPMYIDNKKKRGYNQTELISKEISKSLNINYDNKILIKNKMNKTQSLLNENERIENIKGVYSLRNPEKIKNKKILIFDDICTTGSTVKECYKIIKKQTKEISILVLAKSNYRKVN